MDLANEIIERQNHLKSENFRVGFKIDAYMKSLTMHVISDDFYSESMRRVKHWNSFHTDLFLTYQAVYAMLNLQGLIDPLPADEAEKLRRAMPLQCNQCDFSSDTLLGLKGHLFEHWRKRERKFEVQKKVDKLTSLLDEATLNSKPSTNADEEQTESQAKNEKATKIKSEEHPLSWRRKTPLTPETQYQNHCVSGNPRAVGGKNRPTYYPQDAFQQPLFNQQQGYQYRAPQMWGVGQVQPHFNPFHKTPNPGPPVPFRNQYSQQMWDVNQVQPHFNPFRQTPSPGQPVPFRLNGPSPNINKPNWRPKAPQNQVPASTEGSYNHKNKNANTKQTIKPNCQEPNSKNSVKQNQNQCSNITPKSNQKPAESTSPKQSGTSAAIKTDQAEGEVPTEMGKPKFKKKWHKKKELTAQSAGQKQQNQKTN